MVSKSEEGDRQILYGRAPQESLSQPTSGLIRSTVRRALACVPFIGAIALLIGSYIVIRNELDQHGWAVIWNRFTETSPTVLMLAIICVAVNYVVMTGYDTLANRYINSALPYRKTALVAAVSYSISNTIGATFLSGSALRYRFYKRWGFTVQQIAQIIAFCNLSFWLGMLTTSGVLLLTRPDNFAVALDLPQQSLQVLGFASLSMVVTYLIIGSVMRRSLTIGWVSVPRLSLPIAVSQIMLTCVDWAIAASTIYVLLGPTTIGDLPYVIGVYVVAQFVGVLSSAPGGIGVFETVMILLLPSVASTVDILGALVAFRILHHIVPMCFGLLALMGCEASFFVNRKCN
ncbi:MAG: lysylphosphatidylglycerol synthase domain-containing protein [Cyanobacteria bacterium J06626_14]